MRVCLYVAFIEPLFPDHYPYHQGLTLKDLVSLKPPSSLSTPGGGRERQRPRVREPAVLRGGPGGGGAGPGHLQGLGLGPGPGPERGGDLQPPGAAQELPGEALLPSSCPVIWRTGCL